MLPHLCVSGFACCIACGIEPLHPNLGRACVVLGAAFRLADQTLIQATE